MEKRIPGRLGILAAACLAAAPSLAQDVMSSPTGKKVLLDNDKVRVIEMTLAPGRKEPVHTHPANFAYVLTPGKVRVAYVGGESAEMDAAAGQVIWSDPEPPHTLENLGTKPVKAVLVELKEHPYVAAPKGTN